MNCVEEAVALANLVTRRKTRIVLAESCTAGMAAALLTLPPGASQWFCGSSVVYRERTKQDWLGVSATDLEAYTAVSAPVARAMAYGVLKKTDEAEWAAAITGHLGPESPPGFDGVVFVGLAKRTAAGIEGPEPIRAQLQTHERARRQDEAAALLLRTLREAIENAPHG